MPSDRGKTTKRTTRSPAPSRQQKGPHSPSPPHGGLLCQDDSEDSDIFDYGLQEDINEETRLQMAEYEAAQFKPEHEQLTRVEKIDLSEYRKRLEDPDYHYPGNEKHMDEPDYLRRERELYERNPNKQPYKSDTWISHSKEAPFRHPDKKDKKYANLAARPDNLRGP